MKEYIVADAHTDFLSRACENTDFLQAGIGQAKHVTKDGLKQGNVGLQIFACFTDSAKADPVIGTLRQIATFWEMVNQWDGIDVLSKDNVDMVSNGEMTYAMPSIEGAEAFKGSIQALSTFVHLGVKAITLTWNHENEVGIPACIDENAHLKPFAKELIPYMNANGVAVDVSHLNVKGFWDAIDISSKPLMASHSNVRKLCGTTRNLHDDQIKAIIDTNGYIGMNFYTAFLTEEKESHISDIVRHANYILDMGGENVLGMGSDFDGIDSMPVEIKGIQDFQLIMNALADSGIDDATMQKISHGNLARYLGETMV